MDLSKSDKKAARIIINKGINKEFENGLVEFSIFLKTWEEKKYDNGETYRTLYRNIMDFNKHIAFMYDRLTGSQYLFTIIAQLRSGVIDNSDLAGLSEETRDKIKTVLSFDNL